jgi:putative ABC transport system permease protein
MANHVMTEQPEDAAWRWLAMISTNNNNNMLLQGSLSSSPPAGGEKLVHVSTLLLLLSAAPLGGIALISWRMDLKLASPIVVGCIRTFLQLTILGFILQPIFVLGIEHAWLVIFYTLLMVLLASYESVARSKYHFQGMLYSVLASLLLNFALVSLFTFLVIVRPQPLWDPQYVIPIVGMLLGNCMNGIALSLNAIIAGLVEQQREVELYLSFGATGVEASSRLVREAVRVGAMPMINTMSVIGIISIPGMMTGQILGGSPVMEAARYQILIIYLIAMCTFSTILANMGIALWFGFDSAHMLCSDRFTKRRQQLSFLDRVSTCIQWLCRCCCCCCIQATTAAKRQILLSTSDNGETQTLNIGVHNKDDHGAVDEKPSRSAIEVKTIMMRSSNGINGISNPHLLRHRLEIRGIARSFSTSSSSSSTSSSAQRVVLFQNLSYTLEAGEIALVAGPSGIGKSQLLRVVAGLSPMDKDRGGEIYLSGQRRDTFASMTTWRREVRYVTQYKVDIPGTPNDFIRRITSLQSWRATATARTNRAAEHDVVPPPTLQEMTSMTLELVQHFGLEASKLDCEWNVLSGGEAQRVIVAVALASRPRVLLFDESTSSLDLDSKIRVEQTVQAFASKWDMNILWITHDQDQINRLGALH